MEDSSNNSAQTPNKSSKALLIVVIAIAVLAVASVAALMIANPSSAPTATDASTTSQSNPDTNTGDTTPTEDADSTADTATITFTNSGFSPSTLTVKKGTKITVVNNSSTDVEFSSDDHPTHRENPEMNTQEIGPGESTTFTATTPGTHGFHDHLDDNKTGTLTVTE